MKKLGWWLGTGASAVGYLALYTTARTQTTLLLSIWVGLFLLYLIALRYGAESRFKVMLGAAIAFRLISLGSLPHLSDDLYRFIWDGRLLAGGYNPYLYLPSELLSTEIALRAGLTDALFQKLNSPGYYTVYPPLLQGWFAIAAWLGSTELAVAFWLRLPILLGELTTLWLLYQLLRLRVTDPITLKRSLLMYALNPLVIVELTANIHYEGLTICFILAGLYYIERQKDSLSAVAMGLAAGVKLLPLIFLPALLSKKSTLKNLSYFIIVGIVFLLPFLFFSDEAIVKNISTSLDLYFRRFEFNASLYYVFRAVGTSLLGYNPIAITGPLLALLAATLILFFSWSSRWSLSLAERWVLVLAVYLFCATTVHPWYITPLIALSVLTRFRFPLVWSVLLPLTYVAYGLLPFYESPWIVGFEYLLVLGWMSREIWLFRMKPPQTPYSPAKK